MTTYTNRAIGLLLATTALSAVASGPALADARDDRINALEQKLEAAIAEIRALKQEQAAEKTEKDAVSGQIADLKRGQAVQYADQQATRAADVKVTLANGRPTLATPDGSSSISIRSLVQFDTAYFSQKNRGVSGTDLSSGTNFRRARLGVDGKIVGDWSYSFLYDLGGSGVEGARLSDAYIQYDGLAPFHFRTGSFATPFGLEDQTGTGDLIFLERAGPADLARSIAGSDGRKNILSVFAYGDDYYAAATWSGARAADAAVFDAQQAIVGRAAYRVYKDADTNVVVSGSGTYVFKIADTAAGPVGPSAITFQEGPENTVDGTRLISSGGINARNATVWGAEAAANWKNFYTQAGYFGYGIGRRASALPDPSFDGWYAQGTWVLTGERRAYNATTATFGSPRAAKPFNLKTGDLGAWELTARYSVVDLNFNPGVAGSNVIAAAGGIRGGRQEGYTVGLNWYPNPVLRFLFDYQHLNIDRLGTTAPFGQIGQKVDIAAARAQFAF
jgi:phosphate-selective porin OprO/OprP